MVAIGLAIGFVLAMAATRLETSVLFGVRPLDAFSLLAAFSLLGVATLGASWAPARRAASIEPMQALRSE
jgi:ABC-type antimicrobial peptide transport system permease subunit